MRKFVKRYRDEEGLTLVELIATLALVSIMAGIISSTLIFGFRSYDKITIENSLREEADIVMSSIITELYTFVPDRIRPWNDIDLDEGIILERDSVTSPSIKEWESIRIMDDGSIRIGKINRLESPTLVYEEEEDSSDNTDPRTMIQAEVKPESYVSLECRRLTSCESGLIKIKLVLSRSYDGREYDLAMESKFGF
ncbi:prepilin-type N-terminal cleavage/methylation domain-containing protein [Paenibacillus sp. DS2015]|uniref:pilus assembly FimT family protein n=1 Tax=Paenibacillus sp. DS2015 TaxID=3373917 RepID=UPI003D1EAF48